MLKLCVENGVLGQCPKTEDTGLEHVSNMSDFTQQKLLKVKV
jgi:hypothetical protein